jgi:hypothetical protein
MARVVIGPKTTSIEIKVGDKALILFRDEIETLLKQEIKINPNYGVLVMKYPPLTKFQSLVKTYWFVFLAPIALYSWWWLLHINNPYGLRIGVALALVFMWFNWYDAKIDQREPVVQKKAYKFPQRQPTKE